MDEVKPDRQLKGKTNFISWKREFERAARANDVLEFLTGEEVVPPKPNKDEYFVKVLDTETRRSTRIKKSLSPTTDDENETDDSQAVVLTTNNTLRWQIDHNEHKNAKEKMKLASRLLDAWISDGIKIEIEDFADAKEAYEFIKKRYAVTNERARDILLNRLHDLKLDHCESVTDYTNRVRQIKADLKTVKYDMTDDMFATALLHGLPPNYRSFKEKIPTPDVAITDNNPSEDGSEPSSDSNSDHDDGGSRHDQHTVISSDEEIADQEHQFSEATHGSQDEVEDADDEEETDDRDLGPTIVSKYFNQTKHAGMAKRKVPDEPIVAPRKSRRATHGLRDIELDHSDSDLSDSNDDSWYYSEDEKISQAYWQFVAKHGGKKTKAADHSQRKRNA
ncbi:uncharacterized protein N7511_008477 [Penicillium nucicola]|uniref:uncharacterized protein n=1 Tax=Penicillium nucicola TaxID=1850975 RepID=UPI002544DABA|nr:uncharacterized protein N7511_011418 [Penicillium nucicola]XP_056981585.1 uncharacterized protein N7511_008477 [Penicillium nucicola]KAJ5742399.1 hypothetical protein N7511_011418 [Penicillium nucicola]KAJ5751512.1 hypothetical protein N7511_008477 [Penicillium nucicola]